MLTTLILLSALASAAVPDDDYKVQVTLAGKTEAQIRADVARASREVCANAYPVPQAPRWACVHVLTRQTMAQIAARKAVLAKK